MRRDTVKSKQIPALFLPVGKIARYVHNWVANPPPTRYTPQKVCALCKQPG